MTKQPTALFGSGTAPDALVFAVVESMVETRYAYLTFVAYGLGYIGVFVVVRIEDLGIEALTGPLGSPRCVAHPHERPLLFPVAENTTRSPGHANCQQRRGQGSIP